MSVEITLTQVKNELSVMGYSSTDLVLTSTIAIVNNIDGCLDSSGYSDDVIRLIKLYSIVLMLSSSDVKRVSSESAPRGSSRSYQYFEDGRKSLLATLDALDTKGCTNSLPIVRNCELLQFNVIRG